MTLRSDSNNPSTDDFLVRVLKRVPWTASGPRTANIHTLNASAGLMIAATVISGILNYAYTVALTQLLPTRSYSAFSSSLAILLVGGTVANAAVPWVLAQDLGRTPSELEGRRAFSAGLMINVLLGLVAAGACVLFARSFLGNLTLIALALGAFGYFVASTGMGWALGRGRYLVLATMVAGEVGIKVVSGILLVEGGAGLFGAVAAVALGSLAVIVTTIVIIGPDRHLVPPGLHFGRILRSCTRLSIVQGLLVAAAVTDVVIVELVLPASPRVAAYQLAATLGRASIFVAMAVTMVVFPTIVGDSRKEDAGRVSDGLRILLVMVIPAWAILATIPRQVILLVVPVSYSQALQFLPLTAASGLLWSVVIFLACNLLAANRFRPTVYILGGCAVVGAVTMALTGPTFGAWGCAVIELVTAFVALVGIAIASVSLWGTERIKNVLTTLPWLFAIVPLALLRPEPAVWFLAATATGALALIFTFPAIRPRWSIR